MYSCMVYVKQVIFTVPGCVCFGAVLLLQSVLVAIMETILLFEILQL